MQLEKWTRNKYVDAAAASSTYAIGRVWCSPDSFIYFAVGIATSIIFEFRVRYFLLAVFMVVEIKIYYSFIFQFFQSKFIKISRN